MKIFEASYIWKYLKLSLPYIPITLEILLFSLIAALILGTAAAVIRIRKVPILAPLVRIMISYVRGTPVLSQLFLVYFGFPQLLKSIGFYIPPESGLFFVILTYGFNMGAAVSENLRSAFSSVGTGQKEAALTIGMSGFDVYRYVLIPQAMVVALPNFSNIFIAALKNTSLAFSVGIIEMMARAKLLGGSSSHYIEAYLAVAVIYYIFYLIITAAFKIAEKYILKFKGAKA